MITGMRQTGRAYRIMETGRHPPFQTLSLGRMDIIRIIEITDTGRLKEELRKEGWVPDDAINGWWNNGDCLFRLTDAGFHAYIGPDEQCPPFDDIDMLEPVNHGNFTLPRKGDTKRHAAELLAGIAYKELMQNNPVPEKVRASDLISLENHIDDAWRIADEMEGLSPVPPASKWNGLIRRLEKRLETMERRQRAENLDIIRSFQLLAAFAVAADVAQWVIALPQAGMPTMIISLIALAAIAGYGTWLAFHWHPKD